MAGFTIPGGKSKGTAIGDADDGSIKYWYDRIGKDLADNPDKPYADRDRGWLAAARAELAKRGVVVDDAPAGAQRAQQAPRPHAGSSGAERPQAALARRPDVQVVAGSFHEAAEINAQLESAKSQYHLVSPATSCGSLPEGCEVALSLIKVDPNTDKGGPGEVAPVGGGKLSLSGFVLKRIGAAAGISWDMNATGRLDDGSDPHYASYRAVGWVKNFDGSARCISGEVEIDMREGSPQLVAMKARAKDGANIDSQIRDTRLFLLRHAETKAKLRAIADMGVKRSYTAAELSKPFCVARLMWTGRTNDPELKRVFAEKTADAMIGAASTMYGTQSAPVPRAPAALQAASQPPAFAGHPPPALGTSSRAWDDEPEFIDMEQPYETPAPRPTPKPAPQPPADPGANEYANEERL